MLSFLQSGWFWLLVGSLLLLLAGCLLLPKKAPIEIPTSPHPILSFTVAPFASENLQLRYLEPNFSYIFTPTTSTIQRQISPPTDDDYYASIPNCFTNPNGGYSCLGRVWNNSNQASGSILLRINFLDELGQTINYQNLSTEQTLITSQSFAPYRAIIPAQTSGYQRLEAKIERNLAPDNQLRSLSVIDSRGQLSSAGRYRLTATVVNDLGETVEDLRLFASLVDDEQHIIAYRIYEVGENLRAGERRVFELEIIPQSLPLNINHELYVEGRAIAE